jgi:DCN1-like protein 1/2
MVDGITRVDSVAGMKAALPRLKMKLGSDPAYFQLVYNHTFDFARSPGQRSLGRITAFCSHFLLVTGMLLATDVAQAFWGLLLPHGLQGGALSRRHSTDEDDDVDMTEEEEEGWQDEHTQWWFEFLNTKGGKGISKDTWVMVRLQFFLLPLSLKQLR